MSVETDVMMTDRPAAGGIELHPLGGDGMVSPQSVYHGRIESAGDASGGYNQIRVGFDPRYTQLVAQIMVEATNLAADEDVDLRISESADSALAARSTMQSLPISAVTVDGRATWSPIPYLVAKNDVDPSVPPNLKAVMDNVNGGVFRLYFHVFNFDRRARESVPIEVLSRCLIRAESLI